jgi:chaperone required for assembly of F1-ATPase
VKRFYRDVSVGEAENGWRVLLDGRGIKTAGGAQQIVPTPRLAQTLAAEWAGQGEEMAPERFVQRDLADYAIDVVAPGPQDVIAGLLPYAETDTLCYRGEPDEPIAIRQNALWEPLLAAAERRHDIRFIRISGIVHHSQPAETLDRLRTVLAAQDPFTLAALQTLASLAASLVIALAALEDDADAALLWDAANLEEDWQAQLWGKDAQALARRERSFASFTAAMQFAILAR